MKKRTPASAGSTHRRVSSVNRTPNYGLSEVLAAARRRSGNSDEHSDPGYGWLHNASDGTNIHQGTRRCTHPNVPSGGNTTMGSTA